MWWEHGKRRKGSNFAISLNFTSSIPFDSRKTWDLLCWIAYGRLERHRVLKNKVYFRCVWRKALLTGWKKIQICLFWVKNRPFPKYLQKSLKLLSYTPTTNNASRIGKWWAKIDKVVDLIHFISDAEITMFWMLLISQRSLITREEILFLAGENRIEGDILDKKTN